MTMPTKIWWMSVALVLGVCRRLSIRSEAVLAVDRLLNRIRGHGMGVHLILILHAKMVKNWLIIEIILILNRG